MLNTVPLLCGRVKIQIKESYNKREKYLIGKGLEDEFWEVTCSYNRILGN